ncbi:MAG: hypothetical protein WKF77_29345 [Planctomycetaceae bacterium]
MTVAVLGLTPLLAFSPPAASAEPPLADVIAAVRQNEPLYQDIDVIMKTTYEIGARTPHFDGEVTDRETRTRYVAQGEWFRLERSGSSKSADRTASRDRVRAFDGRTTRLLEQKAIGNVANERLEDADFIRPHLLAIRYSHETVPLSVYLSGHDAIRAHPNGHVGEGITMQITYEGEDMFDGLKCHKVLLKRILKSGHVHDGEEFWLAADRNYLPIRMLAHTYRFSESQPVAEGKELHEVEPEVWFPSEVVTTAYNKLTVQQTGRRELQWRERHVVEKVALAPKYDREFYSRVEYPLGTAMYELEKGKIVRSWRQGDQ